MANKRIENRRLPDNLKYKNSFSRDNSLPLRKLRKKYILKVLEERDKNKSQAAEILQMTQNASSKFNNVLIEWLGKFNPSGELSHNLHFIFLLTLVQYVFYRCFVHLMDTFCVFAFNLLFNVFLNSTTSEMILVYVRVVSISKLVYSLKNKTRIWQGNDMESADSGVMF